MLLICLSVFALLLVMGAPIVIAIGMTTMLPGLLDPSFSGTTVFIVRNVVAGANSTALLALPLFIVSGAIMSAGGISDRLFNVFAYLVGKRTAGMPCAVVITCLFYGAISGSGPATAAAVGGMSIPLLVSLGYDPVFTAALVATAGGLGTVIPPSIPFINYGVVTGTSISDLFIAGVIPGCLIALCLCAYSIIYCKWNGEDKDKISEHVKKLHNRGFVKVVLDSFWALLTPVIILGSIYGGICTPTEAAAFSVLYAVVVSVFIYRSMTIRDLYPMLISSVKSYGPLCLLLAICTAFSRILLLLNVPNMLSNFIIENFNNSFVFFLACNVLFLVLGMFIDAGPALLILAPIVMPAATAMGINPIHFGIVMVVNLCIGFVSPPFGVNLFVTAPLAKVSVVDIGKKAIGFILFFLIALLIITYIPSLSLCLL